MYKYNIYKNVKKTNNYLQFFLVFKKNYLRKKNAKTNLKIQNQKEFNYSEKSSK